jgi:glycosyltransferase involved in cell wall biosynthesis
VVNVPMPQRNRTLPYQQESVEIVVPVYNEQEALSKSIPALCAYLDTYFPYRWLVVIADNASTDATLAVAEGLAFAYPSVSYLSLEEKGRGRALKAAWLASEADIDAYRHSRLYGRGSLHEPMVFFAAYRSLGHRPQRPGHWLASS